LGFNAQGTVSPIRVEADPTKRNVGTSADWRRQRSRPDQTNAIHSGTSPLSADARPGLVRRRTSSTRWRRHGERAVGQDDPDGVTVGRKRLRRYWRPVAGNAVTSYTDNDARRALSPCARRRSRALPLSNTATTNRTTRCWYRFSGGMRGVGQIDGLARLGRKIRPATPCASLMTAPATSSRQRVATATATSLSGGSAEPFFQSQQQLQAPSQRGVTDHRICRTDLGQSGLIGDPSKLVD
jgi:hypothetical protein